MKCIDILFMIALLHMTVLRCVLGQKYFTASFQNRLEAFSEPDENVWIEFLDEIHPSKEFTICHWIKIEFFNSGIDACLWSYCTITNQGDSMQCLQMCLYGTEDSSDRNLKLKVNIPSVKGHLEDWATATLKSYHHRTWTHLCWSLSMITGVSRFYHNGDVIGSKEINISYIDTALKSSTDMEAASFIFGQEPDTIRGNFDKYQAFIGDLSEFNVWNYTLSGPDIYSMAICDRFEKGNIVSWDLTDVMSNKKFGIHNVSITELSDPTAICDINPRLVIFPKKVIYPLAKETCNIHGGSLAVPHS